MQLEGRQAEGLLCANARSSSSSARSAEDDTHPIVPTPDGAADVGLSCSARCDVSPVRGLREVEGTISANEGTCRQAEMVLAHDAGGGSPSRETR